MYFYIFSSIRSSNWIYVNNYQILNNKFDIYISALYYICATVFTIGCEDIIPIFQYIKNFLIYSYSVSALSNYFQSVDNKTEENLNKIGIL